MGKSILEETELEVRVETLSRRNAELEAALKKETLRADNANAGMHIAIAAARAGVKPKAIVDAVFRGLESGHWKSKNGTLIRHTADGLPEEDVTPETFIDSLQAADAADDDDDGYLWPKDVQGDGRAPQQAPAAPQGQKAAPYTGVNPWLKSSWNFTRQVAIKESDPALAERLKADAVKANQAASHGVRTGIPASRYRG